MHELLLLLATLAFLEPADLPGPPPSGYFTGPEDPSDLGPMAVLNQASAAVLEAHPAFATSRAGRDFTYHIPLPQGRYTVRVGYFEDLYFRPGNRVFSILANGQRVEGAIAVDLCEAAGMLPERIDADGDGRISVKERMEGPTTWIHDPPLQVEVAARDGEESALDLRFVASRDLRETVAVSWIEIEGEGVHYLIDCGGEGDLPGWFEDAPVGQNLVARFGSRVFFDLRHQFGEFHESPLGIFSEANKPASERVIKPFGGLIGFQSRQTRYSLPIFRPEAWDSSRMEVREIEAIHERRTPTRLRYDVEFEGIAGAVTITAPFHPTDAKIATAPYFDIEFEARRTRPDAAPVVRAVFFLPMIDMESRPAAADARVAGGVITTEVDGRTVERGLFFHPRMPEPPYYGRIVRKPNGLLATIDLQVERGPQRAQLVYAAYVGDPVLEVEGEPQRFYYTRHFESVEDVAAYAIHERQVGLKASERIDSLMRDAEIPRSLSDLISVAIPSFLANTCFTLGEDGRWWYSCMEGYCRYHATVDVEYNAAPFYLWFAPDLLRHLLDVWPRYLKPAAEPLEGHRFLSHDIGIDDRIDGQQYQHDMPVEENANYVQLLHAYWTTTADDEFVLGKADVVEALLDYIVASDLDGDGFPEVGTANTIDDAPPAVQFSREQTYLGVKSAAAFLAGAEILEAAGRGAGRYVEQARRIAGTLDEQAWLGDHYAVCLDRSTEGLQNPWDNIPEHTNVPRQSVTPLPEGELPGWDEPHPYTAIGLLYLLRSGRELPFDRARLREDLAVAAEACARRFADAHSALGRNGWVSLNLFRDAVQCYLGDDVLDRTERYAALQRYRARCPDERERAGFCDSMYNRYLSYYPRGVAALALVEAAAGMAFDRRDRSLSFRPVRVPIKVPIPYLADWDAGRVPWFSAARDPDSGEVSVSFSEEDLLAGFEITVDLTRFGGKVVTSRR